MDPHSIKTAVSKAPSLADFVYLTGHILITLWKTHLQYIASCLVAEWQGRQKRSRKADAPHKPAGI